MGYDLAPWQNSPSVATKINAANLSSIPIFLDGRQYGIKGDNSTDNATPFANFITALNSAGPGARGILPPGILLTSAPLTYTPGGAGIYIEGHGAGTNTGTSGTVLKKTGNFDLVVMNGTASVTGHLSYCGLSNVTLHGAGGTGRLIDMVYADNIFLRDMLLMANADTGIDAVELWDSLFDNVRTDGVNSTTNPAIWIRSSRAASGFGLSTDNSNVIRIINSRCESWKYGALRVEKGTGGTQNPNQIWVQKFKAESAFLHGEPIHINDDANHVHLKDIYVSMNAFDGGFATAQNGIYFDPGGSGSLRDVMINVSASTALRGVYTWAANLELDNIYGVYNTAPTSGNHVEFAGGGPYKVGNIRAANVTNAVSFASADMSIGPGARNLYGSDKIPATLVDGTDKTPVAGTVYFSEIRIPDWDRLTGLSYLIGTVGGTNNVIVALYDYTGALVANSATAGTLVGTLATWQRVPFTAPKTIEPGRYFYSISFNGTTAHFRAQPAGGDHPTGSATGTFGTLASITPPTTFTADVAPYAMTY